MDSERQFLCPRLIDYLTIVGAKHTPSSVKQNASPHIQIGRKKLSNVCCQQRKGYDYDEAGFMAKKYREEL
ncbi:hypothetical protein HUJ05_000820 [Dendroctonus ponderosae]|nr:hypothetical protein HUJ05_000820 [Dendroctonus ponderosae]